jgi:hypothetical protein
MKCKFCKISKRSNLFGLNGSQNFERSALERHQSSDVHRLAACEENSECKQAKKHVLHTKSVWVGNCGLFLAFFCYKDQHDPLELIFGGKSKFLGVL